MNQSQKTQIITICGAGALGGNLAENLARQGCRNLRLIDYDKVEERNLATQPYYKEDIGHLKIKVLAERLYRSSGAAVEVHRVKLDGSNATILLRDSSLVVDCFDNPPSREIVKNICSLFKIPCLHIGMAEDYAEIVWSERYIIPKQTGSNPCDNPQARDTILIAVATATSGAIIPFFKSGERNSYSITMKDFRIQKI